VLRVLRRRGFTNHAERWAKDHGVQSVRALAGPAEGKKWLGAGVTSPTAVQPSARLTLLRPFLCEPDVRLESHTVA
jgi:hypothetical protein